MPTTIEDELVDLAVESSEKTGKVPPELKLLLFNRGLCPIAETIELLRSPEGETALQEEALSLLRRISD